ncbi:hypothetical protein KAW50_06185 [candidate division WOR-3 bacterium]|nr:hypothetical protein [candidate division WOR-3 bacterium]
MKKWCIALLLCVASMIWADTIELKDGRILGGTIKDTTDERFVNIETYDRSFYSIDRSEVISINYGENLDTRTIKNTILYQPTPGDYILEGVGGVVGGFVGGLAGFYVGGGLSGRFMGAIVVGLPLGVLFGVPTGVAITGDVIVGCKGSYWESLLGTAVGIVAGVGFMALAGPVPISLVSVTFPICGAVWGYHLGGRPSH